MKNLRQVSQNHPKRQKAYPISRSKPPFFRLFDIWKPSFIGKIDRDVKGGLGVMGDDVLAGIAAGIATAGVYQLIEKFIL